MGVAEMSGGGTTANPPDWNRWAIRSSCPGRRLGHHRGRRQVVPLRPRWHPSRRFFAVPTLGDPVVDLQGLGQTGKLEAFSQPFQPPSLRRDNPVRARRCGHSLSPRCQDEASMSHIRQSKQLTHRRLLWRSCSALRTATHPRTSSRRTVANSLQPTGRSSTHNDTRRQGRRHDHGIAAGQATAALAFTRQRSCGLDSGWRLPRD
jgi:hypothetical protein